MKKYIVFMIVLGLFTFGLSAPKVQAVSLSDLQKQIQILSEQVSSLQAQLAGQVIGAMKTNTAVVNEKINPISLPTVDVKRGDSGAKVLGLQDILKTGGYLKDVVDGKFGMNTLTAVMNLQKAKNLPITGVVNYAGPTQEINTQSIPTDEKPVTVKLGKKHCLLSGLLSTGTKMCYTDKLCTQDSDCTSAPINGTNHGCKDDFEGMNCDKIWIF